MSDAPSQQPNSKPTNEKTTVNESKIVAAVAELSHRISTAAQWQRGEIPPDSPISSALRFLPALLLPVLLTLNFY